MEEHTEMKQRLKKTRPTMPYQLSIRFTEAQYELLTEDAQKAHLPRTEYIRQLITNRHPKIHYEVVYNSEQLLHTIGDLGKIGSNLNQIAHHLNGGGGWTADMKKTVLQSVIAIQTIREKINEMAGEYRGGH